MGAKVLVTGFEPFEQHTSNPSGDVALGLARTPPPGVEVFAAVLPVSFRRAAQGLDRALSELPWNRPDLLLLLGVHSRPGWRLEARARMRLGRRGRPDNDGVDAADATAGALDKPDVRFTSLDVGALALSLGELAPEPVQLSFDAGGYVCECTYAHAMTRTDKDEIPTLFVHVPKARFTTVPQQVVRLGDLIIQALAQRI